MTLKVANMNQAMLSYKYRIVLGKRSSITIRNNSLLQFKGKFVTRRNVEIIVGDNATVEIGDRVFMNSNCIISSRLAIRIGNNVQFGPNCLVYDNDHDYMGNPKNRSTQFKCSEVSIGNDVWIGAGTIILRGTRIGDNCVIGAGSIVKDTIPANTLYYQTRNEKLVSLRN